MTAANAIPVELIRLDDFVQYAGLVTQTLDGGAQIRLTFSTGADAYFQRGERLVVIDKH